jgi:hypothetical protein
MDTNEREAGTSDPVGSEKQGAEINCFSCLYFYITYDPQFPYGCRAVRFKARRMPAKEMSASSGIDCQFFARKEKNR